MPDRAKRRPAFLESYATSEAAMSLVLATMLHEPSILSAFLDEIEAAGVARPRVTETLARLRRDPSPQILVEPFLANAGNLDLVVVSRKENAVLAVESKTNSLLGTLQLTKYQLALRDSDPTGGERAFATVLLRPAWREGGATDPDKAKDPAGFENALVISYCVVARVLQAAGGGWQMPEFFSEVAMKSLVRLGTGEAPSRRCAATPLAHRDEQLSMIASQLRKAGGWTLRHRTQTTLALTPPVGGPSWTVKLGGGATSCLNVSLGRTLGTRAWRDSPRRLVDLAGGYKSISIPTPFPAMDRPWTDHRGAPDRERMNLQMMVAVRVLTEVDQAMAEAP